VPGRVELVPAGAGSSTAGLLTARTEPRGVVVEFAGAEVEFVAIETQNILASVLEGRFDRVDANKDGAVDAEEARNEPFLERLFLAADRDGDRKITRSELTGYLELANAAEDARMVLSVSARGNSLYERLDGDGDGRLSVRELRAAASRMAGFDADQDGRISLSEVPKRTQLNVGRGPSATRNPSVVAPPALAANPRARGGRQDLPAWFVGMDRNRDGDVSAREFLGTFDQFRRFDTDGDGLIDGDEATRLR
jgi:Ca2+-binding EF-hand superfamily protein